MLFPCGLYLKFSFLIFMVPLVIADDTNSTSTPVAESDEDLPLHKQQQKDDEMQPNAFFKPEYISVEHEAEVEYYNDNSRSHPAASSQGSSWNPQPPQSQHRSWEETVAEIQAIKNILQTKPGQAGRKTDINISIPVKVNEYGSLLEKIYQKVAKNCQEKSSSATEQTTTTSKSHDVDQRNVTIMENNNKGVNKDVTNFTNKSNDANHNHISTDSKEIQSVNLTEHNEKNFTKKVIVGRTNDTNKPSNVNLNTASGEILKQKDPNGGLGNDDREFRKITTANWSLEKKETKPMYLIVGDNSGDNENVVDKHIPHNMVQNPTQDIENTTLKTVGKPPDEVTLTPMECSTENNLLAHNSFNGNSMSFKVNFNVFPGHREHTRSKSFTEQGPQNNYHNTQNVKTKVVNKTTDMIENENISSNTERLSNTDKVTVPQNKNSIEKQYTSYPKNDKPMDSTTNSTRKNERITKKPIEITTEKDFDETKKNDPDVKFSQRTIEDLIQQIENPRDQDISHLNQVHQPWMVAALSYIQQGKPIPEGLKRFIAIKGGIIPRDFTIQSTTAINDIGKQPISTLEPFQKSPQSSKITRKPPPITVDKYTTERETVHSYTNTNLGKRLKAATESVERPHFTKANIGKELVSTWDPIEKSPQRKKVTKKIFPVTDKTTTETLQTYANIDSEEKIVVDTREERPHFNPHWLHRGANLYSTVTAVYKENTAVNVEKADDPVIRRTNFMNGIKKIKTTKWIEPNLNKTRKSCGSKVKPVVVTTIERSNYVPVSDNRFVHFAKTADIMNTSNKTKKST